MSAGVALVVLAAVVVVAIVVGVVVAVVVGRRTASEPAPRPVPATDLAPMSGLEAALDGVMARDGRPIREKIDAEAGQVDSLRVDDDTGPLLRRALDHVAGDRPAAADRADEATRPDDDGSAAGPA